MAEGPLLVGPAPQRRGELLAQLERLRDLYLMGDLLKAQYVMRRQAIEEELQRLGPPRDPGIERARELPADFGRLWELEREPAERRRLLLSLFGQVWAKDGRIVAVRPHDAFLPYFQAIDTARSQSGQFSVRSGSDGGRTPVRHRIEIRGQA